MQWESFIDNLTAGEIVPVLGNDLSLVKRENDDPAPLYEYIARELTRRLEIPYSGQTIGELALAYPNENIPSTCNTIYNKIDEDTFFTDPLEKLAEITDFKFFVTTTLDDLLVKSLIKARNLKKNDLKVIDYSLQQLSDTPTFGDDEEGPPVTVFNLLGSFGNVIESAFNEEEMLEHFLSITSKYNRHPMADYFVQKVNNKILLFLGCDFPDWFMRFNIRILTNQRYKYRNFNDYLVPTQYENDSGLIQFLKYFNKNIIVMEKSKEGNALAFVKELHEQWVESIENRPIQYDGSVFLSYNHADRENVQRLKTILRAKGIRNVWFDIDDLPSGEHRTHIESEIKKCKVFIPLISDTCLSRPESYTWKVEWAAVEARMKADKYYGGMSFHILPIILDDTPRNDERIPSFLRDFSIWNLDDDKERIIEESTKVLAPL
jgi:hypothetical protein